MNQEYQKFTLIVILDYIFSVKAVGTRIKKGLTRFKSFRHYLPITQIPHGAH